MFIFTDQRNSELGTRTRTVSFLFFAALWFCSCLSLLLALFCVPIDRFPFCSHAELPPSTVLFLSRLHGPATFLGLILDIPFPFLSPAAFHSTFFFPFCQGRDPAPFFSSSLVLLPFFFFTFLSLSTVASLRAVCRVSSAFFSPMIPPFLLYCTSTTLFNNLTLLVLLRAPINILIPLFTCVSPSDVVVAVAVVLVVVHFAGSQNGDFLPTLLNNT